MNVHGIIFVVASSVDAKRKKNKNKKNKNHHHHHHHHRQPNIIFILIDDLGNCLINAYNFINIPLLYNSTGPQLKFPVIQSLLYWSSAKVSSHTKCDPPQYVSSKGS